MSNEIYIKNNSKIHVHSLEITYIMKTKNLNPKNIKQNT